jgi:ribose 5-phosphate isomerase A
VTWQEEAKKKVALEAVKHVKDGFVVGLGSGSTAAFAIKELGKMIKQRGLHIMGVPSSSQAKFLALESCIPLTTLDEYPVLDLAIDGADEVDKNLDMIKGGGGALTQEKIVASSAKQVIIVADESKLVDKLGKFKVPIEVLPFGLAKATSEIRKLRGEPFLREGKRKVGAVITDNGNYILDADFGLIDDTRALDEILQRIPGVIETGLFINLATTVYLGKPDGITRLKK